MTWEVATTSGMVALLYCAVVVGNNLRGSDDVWNSRPSLLASGSGGDDLGDCNDLESFLDVGNGSPASVLNSSGRGNDLGGCDDLGNE
jgi:hypothetical protein